MGEGSSEAARPEQQTISDSQQIDFVTLGMLIIGVYFLLPGHQKSDTAADRTQTISNSFRRGLLPATFSAVLALTPPSGPGSFPRGRQNPAPSAGSSTVVPTSPPTSTPLSRLGKPRPSYVTTPIGLPREGGTATTTPPIRIAGLSATPRQSSASRRPTWRPVRLCSAPLRCTSSATPHAAARS